MMEIQRFVLFVGFSVSLLLLWEAWQKDRSPQPAVAAGQQKGAADKGGVPTPTSSIGVPTPTAVSPRARDSVPVQSPAGQAHDRIKVNTDKLRAEIDPMGGSIVFLELLEHPDAEKREKNFVLLGPQHHYAVQSGLIGEGLPNHRTLFNTGVKEYTLDPGKESLEVMLEANGTGVASGVKVRKTVTFYRGSYLIDIAEQASNGSDTLLTTHAYAQVTRDSKAPDGTQSMSTTYIGPAMFTEQEKFRKLPFGDIDSKSYSKAADNGWIALLQHYFVVALVPSEKQGSREFYTRKLGDDLYAAGVILPMAAISPGASGSSKLSIYAGPQEQDKLKIIASGLDLVVDYGWLTVIAAPLFWVLQFFHQWLGNWGLAIIFLTVMIKLIFYPLSAASYRSMAKMKQVTPRLTKIREQYADDRMKQNQAMMDLYKQEKINPLGGCLPIVVQIPVFISLYWVLLASVELREAPFYGWITDLASADPYYILPALMMASMIVQTKMSPMPPDPVQAKVMQIMPFVFGVMFFVFPAGLVLYWLVNNVLSILQQWHITRTLGQPKASAKR